LALALLSAPPELIPDQWWISAHASANDLGSDQGYSIVQIDQLLMKGSAEISSEFHPELIPDPTTDLSGGKPDANLLDLGSEVVS